MTDSDIELPKSVCHLSVDGKDIYLVGTAHVSKESVEDVRSTSKMLKDCSIMQMGFLLLGGPGETEETVKTSLNFADTLELEAVRVTTGIRIYPNTVLAKIAIDDGLISPADDLLRPRFYIVRGIEDWLRRTVKDWMAERPNWIS